MDVWTVDQVGHWLQVNGLEKYVRKFIDEDIDGAALRGLRENDISNLLSLTNEDGTRKTPTLRIERKFRKILDEYRTIVERRNSSSLPSSGGIIHPTNEEETYSKTYIVEPTSGSWKFFQNELICSYLSNYFLKKYHVRCQIPMANQSDRDLPLHMKLFGVKEHVKRVQRDLRLFFTTIERKVFNDEQTNKRIIRWSKCIHSDSALIILQRIFFDKKQLTIWEKSNVLSGYYVVHYVTGQHEFGTSEELITEILNHDITYAKDIVIGNIEKKFREELDEFIREKKKQQQRFQTMIILYSQYFSPTKMKISFFGLRNQVYMAKKQIKILINKHRMRTIRLGLDSKQREYLLDNYVHELKNLQLDHDIQISIREDVIHVPQYLISKIRQSILSMIYQTSTLSFQSIEHAFLFTEKDQLQLQVLARNYACEIDRMNTETTKELIDLPIGKTAVASKHISKESNQFYSSLTIPRILSIGTNTIEIHPSSSLQIDITVLSTLIDAEREQIDPKNGNAYFESDTGKKMMFIHWPLPRPQKGDEHIRRSIKKFISACFTRLDTLCTDTIKTIAFSTTDWEKYDHRKELVEGILDETKSQLGLEQFAHRSWKILFIFPNKEKDFFNEFSHVIDGLQTKRNDYEQFFYSVTTTSITLKTSGNTKISKCENALNTYWKKHLLSTIRLDHLADSPIWNEHMIHAFYKYCLEKFVLPKIHRMNEPSLTIQCLELIGPISAVHEVQQKYELMSGIEQQRIIARNQISESDGQSPDLYNILLSCCPQDQILSRQLADRLTDEGYSVSINYSLNNQSSNIESKLTHVDVVLICFSYEYSQDGFSMNSMISIKKSPTKFIPILLTKAFSNDQDSWLKRNDTEQWFYESFEEEIRFRLTEELNLDYDRLILELFQHTQPGAVARTYPISKVVLEEKEQREETLDHHEKLTPFTSKQIREKERIYQQWIEQIREQHKISDDEVARLIQSLKTVLENRLDEDHETPRSASEENKQQDPTPLANDLNELFSSIQRWLEKATNGPVIRGSLPPFSLTGDYNDAVFPMPWTDKAPWWTSSADLDDFDHSTSDVSPQSPGGSWCNYHDTHRYYQELIDRETQFQKYKKDKRQPIDTSGKRVREDSTVDHAPRYPHFIMSLRKGTAGWDITENREVLREYERRKTGKKRKEDTRLSHGWNCCMDRSVQLITDIKEGNISPKSTEAKGKELKTMAEIREREQLDDPSNETWKKKRRVPKLKAFIDQKIRNTIEWKDYCAKQGNK